MRKIILLVCSIALLLTGCAPKGDPVLRSREDRPYPDPTLGQNNHESQWYQTQILAAPSAEAVATSATTPVRNKPARPSTVPVPTRTAPRTSAIAASPSTNP